MTTSEPDLHIDPMEAEPEGQAQSHASAAHRVREDLRSKCFGEGPERAFLLASHPLYQRPVEILTNAIKMAYLTVLEDIKFKRPGSSFAADFRVGKSTALLMIKRQLIGSVPEVGFELISAKDHDRVTERMFWGDILIAFNLTTTGTAQERQNRVRMAVMASCIEAGGKHFCLLIDEAQNWRASEYTWMRDLSNQLREQDGYTLTTVAWGDLRLEETSAAFRSTRKDLWARFVMTPQKFHGVRSLKDIKYFFSEHDNPRRCEYPTGSGVTFSEFFLPKAFSAGWRLEVEAPNLWDAIARAATKVNRKTGDVGMQWIGESVIRFLTVKSLHDSLEFASLPKDWDDAVEHSNFTNSLI